MSKCTPPPLQHEHICTHIVWPWPFISDLDKSFQQLPLTWRILVTSFWEMPHCIKYRTSRIKKCFRTDEQAEGQPETSMPPPSIVGAGIKTLQKFNVRTRRLSFLKKSKQRTTQTPFSRASAHFISIHEQIRNNIFQWTVKQQEKSLNWMCQ